MKYLIKDNQILQCGIPSHFTRESGEAFWGGYENMTEIHYEDGWRDEIIPVHDQKTHYLGSAYFDEVNDVVTYNVELIVVDLVLEKSYLYRQLEQLRTEMSGIVYQCKLNYDIEPEGLTRLMPYIRAMYGFAKSEIEALTVENVRAYVLRSPKYEQVLSMLETFL
ncbi:MAG TPA: hypothetical protein DCR40_05215 [Prolixibacteraceae bacterium]|nr:hypothetical protein [Prolixibacteraceae bacterium]